MRFHAGKATTLGLLAAAVLCLRTAALFAYVDISPDSLSSWLSSANPPYLLDVREQDEFVGRHIPGAVLFPYNTGVLQTRYGKLPASGPIVVICKAGTRSASAAQFLEGLPGGGFNGRLSRLNGGMDAWKGLVVLDDTNGADRQKVLFEMFTASWCSFCFSSNKYLDDTFLDTDAPIAMIRYHVADVGFDTPTTRVNFLGQKTTPDLFIDGAKEIYPDYFTVSSFNEFRQTKSPLTISLLGRKPASAADSGLLKVKLSAGATIGPDSLNLFVVLTESGIDPTKWDPPHIPENGEKIFDNAMRAMVTGQSGQRFAIQPGEKLEIQTKFGLKPDWKADSCELVVFVEDMKTKKVQQATNVRLPALTLVEPQPNRAPKVTLPEGQSYRVTEGDTLRFSAAITDPDSAETLTVWAFYSATGASYGTAFPPHASFKNPVFKFAPDTTQAGLYRFMLRVVDHAGANDSVRFTVEVLDKPAVVARRCDCDGDGALTVRDILAFLLLLRNDPANQSLDWNGDGERDFADVLDFARDLSAGRCPDALGPSLAAVRNERGEFRLSVEEAAWIGAALPRLHLEQSLESEIRAQLAAVASLPRAYSLAQNVPNPFNPSTVITFDIPGNDKPGAVSLKVYDLRARLVKVLAQGVLEPGRHTVFWDGRDESGSQLPSGVYLCRLTAPGWTQSRKMVLLK
ncbi:Omp28-related outer membrane protein [bacterium]|nr:Omp28-related outer membrane protein [bacterium]